MLAEPMVRLEGERIIPQPHGGQLKHFPKGVSGNPGGRTKLHAECRRLAREICPEAIDRVAQIMRQTDDPRAALIAAQTILDRGLGKPKEDPDESQRPSIDMSRAPPEALALIRQALALIAAAPAPKQEVIPPGQECESDRS